MRRTARDSEDDIVRALSNGGDDYLVKPPKQRELLARVAAVLRRHNVERGDADTFALGPYQIDAQRRRCFKWHFFILPYELLLQST